jgi:hypothetical protein
VRHAVTGVSLARMRSEQEIRAVLQQLDDADQNQDEKRTPGQAPGGTGDQSDKDGKTAVVRDTLRWVTGENAEDPYTQHVASQ